MRASQGMNAYGLVWAGILLALPHATFVAATIVNSKDVDLNQSPEMGQSRVLVSDRNMPLIWSWFMPIFARTSMSSSFDGYVAGVGIRVCKGFFLANVRTMVRINNKNETQDRIPKPPGNFMLRAYQKPHVEVGKPNTEGFEWYPELVKEIAPRIQLYYLARKTQDVKRVFETNRITQIPRFDLSEDEPKNCKLVSLGNMEREAMDFIQPNTKRYVRYVDVNVARKCDTYDICNVEIVGGGKLCGTHGELGAPIICGAITPSSTIKYVVYDWGTLDETKPECYKTFKAVRMKRYVSGLVNTVLNNMNKETAVEDIGTVSSSLTNPYYDIFGTIEGSGLPFMCAVTAATT